MRVSVEDMLPLEGTVTVTGFGELTLTPLGAAPFQPAVRLTVELKPSIDDSMMLADCDEPGDSDTTAGEGWLMAEVMEKSGDTGANTEGVPYTVSAMSDECEITPFVAVTANVYVPVEGELSAVRVRIDEALPPAGIVTGVGRLTAMPSGATPVQSADKLTEELNPFTEENTIVVDFETPGVRVITSGEGWVRKSGLGVETKVPAGVTVSDSAVVCDKPVGLVPIMANV